MSMNTYPLCIPVAFFIDYEVAAYIILKQDVINGTVPDTIDRMLRDGTFVAAAKSGANQTLKNESYYDVSLASDILAALNIDHCYCSQFNGDVDYLNPDLTYQRSLELCNSAITLIEPNRQSSPIEAAYTSVEEIMFEFKAALQSIDTIPTNFDWYSKLVETDGVYSC